MAVDHRSRRLSALDPWLTARWEWRASDQRNWLGIAPGMIVPLAAVAMFLAVFHWPTDNDPAKFAKVFDPAVTVDLFNNIYKNTPCDAYRFQHGKCAPGQKLMPNEQQRHGEDIIMVVMPLLMGFFLFGTIFRPKTLFWLFRVKKER